jgi:hypothetical protein
LDLDGCKDLRRYLLKIESDSDLSWLLQKLAKPQHCDEAIFAELTRTTAIRKRMEILRLDKLLPKKTSKRESKHKQDKPRSDRPERSQHQAWLSGLDPETKAEILRSLISREQLYDEVWAEPVTKVAERYGVSDVAVAKWCRKMNVPRPGRGYWARKSAGRRVKREPLPAAKGHQQYVSRPKPSEERPRVSTKVPGLDLFEKPIPIPREAAPEHPLVEVTRVALESATPDDFCILRHEAQGVLDVFVSRSSVNRALRIMNALILALEGAGFPVEVKQTSDSEEPSTGHATVAVINGERIPFHLFETLERKERAPTYEERMEMRTSWRVRGPFYTYSPTGVLTLQIEGDWYQERHRRKWTDGKPRPLEDCLYSFVRSLLLSACARRGKRNTGC